MLTYVVRVCVNIYRMTRLQIFWNNNINVLKKKNETKKKIGNVCIQNCM